MVEDTIQDVVERIHRYGDRGRNAGDSSAEQEARDAAQRAQDARSLSEALRIEQALQQGSALEDAPEAVAQVIVPKKKKSFWQRWFGGGDDDDSYSDNS